MKRFALTACVMALAIPAFAADFEVEQKNKAFGVAALKVKVGDTVGFRNADPFGHNVFSLSDAKSFDLGSYPTGQSKKVTFDKPGIVEIECALHPDMKMTIQVQK
jgi:plastocyanin